MSEMHLLRVGDAERQTAVSALGEHLAAGRLSVDEYDERAGRAWSARYNSDLAELFDDLPRSRPSSSRSKLPGRAHRPRPWVLLPAIALLGTVLFAMVQLMPWILFALLALWVFGGFGLRRRRFHRYGPRSWSETHDRHGGRPAITRPHCRHC